MSFFVYTIHNIKNNKIYVGKTTNLKNRWLAHQSVARNIKSNQYIHKSMRKYGFNNFIFSIVQEFVSQKEYNIAEKYWISYFNSCNSKYGYNLTDGGDGSAGRKQSIETRQKISKTKMGTMIGENNSFYGKHHSIETKRIISKNNSGLKKSDEFKKQKSINMLGENNHFYNKKHTKETLKKISGENSSSAKLSEQQILDIILLFKQNTYSQRQISLIYKISQSQISRIINGKRWSHLINKGLINDKNV